MAMGLFRRSMSSNSSRSCTTTSTTDSASDIPSSRTSFDSFSSFNDISDSLITIKHTKKAPVLALPVELVQQVSIYLDDASSAAFCLSSRYIYYALGTDTLSTYVGASKNRFEKRRTIEAVVERAFPGHWFCAWCDKFHAWGLEDGPNNAGQEKEKKRDCADFNSYLHAGPDYILRYHHIRLALNAHLWGPEHGLLLSTFEHTEKNMAKISRTPVPTNLKISAKIVEGHFLLHTSFAIILPSYLARSKLLLKHLWPTLPHILSGHRDSENGHTGLMAAIDNVVRRGWKYPHTQNCSSCATDWSVTSHEFPHVTGGQARLVVQSWRDLGTGRTPFESGWRAHGVCTGLPTSSGTQIVKLKGVQAGDIRRAFETVMDGEEDEVTAAARSTSRSHVFRSFIRKASGGDDAGDAIRRSSARPRAWRTRSENEEVFRRYEEERLGAAASIAETMVRLDAERGRRR
jgi:hypothetical protein